MQRTIHGRDASIYRHRSRKALLELLDIQQFPWGTGYVLAAQDGSPVYATDKRLFDAREGVWKWKIGVSLCSGCMVGCIYCFTNTMDHFRPLSADEIEEQVAVVMDHARSNGGSPHGSPSRTGRVKVSFKQMGEPVTNAIHTLEALARLYERHRALGVTFIVSTSGPKKPRFFQKLKNLRNDGIGIRLQFSCHTTDDHWRQQLSPNLPMMGLPEIASVVEDWHIPDERVTLTFVPMRGVPLAAEKIIELFDPNKVFIKISYLDPNPCTRARELQDMPKTQLASFITDLDRHGFVWAHRNRAPIGDYDENPDPCA